MKRSKNKILRYLIISVVIIILTACSFFKNEKEVNPEIKRELASWYYQNRFSEDSIKHKLQEHISVKNDLGTMLGYKQLGLYYRENARFTEAIVNHQENLSLALKLNDTVEIVQAYNNLGTDLRRIASHGEASNYHYMALNYAEAYSKSNIPGVGMKNKVIALNGIGNISLTLGYLEHAEKHFRLALEDEIRMDSDIGQAINYANIGAIYEKRNQLDSAHLYYNKSLEFNQKARSDVGIGLCLIHIGNLYEKENKLEKSKNEYFKAYELMHQISDRWHWLEACISIARINLLENNFSELNHYLSLAEETANEINSPRHLADLYLLKHRKNIKQSDFKLALENYKIYKELEDSVQGVHKANRFLDVRLNYEQNKNLQDIERIEALNKARNESKQRTIYFMLILSVVGALITVLLFYAYRQRVKSNQILRQLEQYRTDFYTNITHEFRTPLTVIKGFNSLLYEKQDLSEKEISNYHAAIARQSNNLLELVNQLLDIAKLKSGKNNPTWYRGDIIAYLQMIVETFQLLAKSKGVNLSFYSAIAYQEMDFVPFYIDKIVGNILSNAIKYTVAGDKIDFVVVKGKNSNTIILRFIDTGIGMSQEEKDNIFEMFFQSKSNDGSIGSGIGMPYSLMMIEKMKGKIEVESELGKGSSFTVYLPIINKSIDKALPLSIYNSNLSDNNRHVDEKLMENEFEVDEVDKIDNQAIVLIVEDNKDVNAFIHSILKDSYQIYSARNGQEALEIATEIVPDVIVTDLMMPIMDGYELCRRLQENPLLNHIPIIMLTAKSSNEDRVKGLRCGAVSYLTKPFAGEELNITIENLLKSRKVLIDKYLHIIESSGVSHNSEIDENINYLEKITDIIYSEIQNPDLSSVLIAEKMSVSVSQLNRKMNAITGKSTLSYILQVKLTKAKRLLNDEKQNLSMLDIALASGFYDANYFSRVFKKEFGVTPSQYQRIPNS